MSLRVCIAVLFLLPIQSFAQSCPESDSLFGVWTKEYKPRTFYDKMADTTQIGVANIVSVPMMGDPATVMFMGMFEGKSLKDSAILRMTAEFKQQGEGGALMGRSRNGTGALTTSMSKFAEVKEAKLLLDDSVRISIPVESYKAAIKKAGAFFPEQLVETLTFLVHADQRIKISKTRSGIMRIGEYQLKVGKGETEGIRNFTRWTVCNRSATKPPSP